MTRDGWQERPAHRFLGVKLVLPVSGRSIPCDNRPLVITENRSSRAQLLCHSRRHHQQGSGCNVRTQDPENFDEEVKSLVTAWRSLLQCYRLIFARRYRMTSSSSVLLTVLHTVIHLHHPLP